MKLGLIIVYVDIIDLWITNQINKLMKKKLS